MNWIKKTLNLGEKIKKLSKLDQQKKILKIVNGHHVAKDQF